MTPATPEIIARNLARVHARMLAVANRAGRDPGAVRLLAVSKAQPVEALIAARAAGQNEFGENYVQEALAKRQSTQQLHGVIWHFTGTLQANKTRLVAENFDWVHTVDRRKIAQRLNDQRPTALPLLNVCIEVNLDGEASKSGIAPGQLAALAEYVSGLPRLKLRGLMALPAVAAGPAEQRRPFRELRQLLEALNQRGHALDTLSMGMSADFEAAIMEGATLLRLGTAIFGARAASRS